MLYSRTLSIRFFSDSFARSNEKGLATTRRSYCMLGKVENLITAPFSGYSPSSPSRFMSEERCIKLLSQFNRSGSFERGICVHSPIIKLCLINDQVINNTLLSVYSKSRQKSDNLSDARKLFEELSERDVVSWTIMMTANAKSGQEEKTLEFFEEMISSGAAIPNEFTLSCLLKSCSSLREETLGLEAHAQSIKLGFDNNEILLSALALFYSEIGCFGDALKAFSEIQKGDAISWTSMISSLLEGGFWVPALKLFSQMTNPNEFTFSRLLSATSDLGLRFGESIHSRILSSGVDFTLILKTSLVDMYSKFRRMGDAQKVFNETPESDHALWTAMISGYLQDSDPRQAINKFCQMEVTGISPGCFSYASVLSACSSLQSLNLGLQIHSRVLKSNLDSDPSVGNSLMDFYNKCFSLVKAPLLLFSAIRLPNVISWTVLISSLVHRCHLKEALSALLEMQIAGIQPNSFTLSTILKGLECKDSLMLAPKFHAYILKNKCRFLSDLGAWNSLLDAYFKIGESTRDLWKIFNEMPFKDAITITNLASGLNKMGFHSETLNLIFSLQEEDIEMDSFILPCFLSAASGLTSIQAGRQLHCYSVKSNLDSRISVVNGLIDLYGKCGDVDGSRTIFSFIKNPNLVSWNSLIVALSSNGFFSEALSAFENFKISGENPDGITLLIVLYACSHSGLTDLGMYHFNSMRELHGICPQIDHYICAVDLLGRSGRVAEASALIQEMPFNPDALIYKTLLGSCRLHRNIELGEFAATRAIELDPNDPAIYVLLSRIYEDAGKIKLAEEMRMEMRNRGIKKDPGKSWVEIRNRIYFFTAKDGLDPEMEELHNFLDNLEKKMGFLRGSSDRHCEKLALAFGVLNSTSGGPLRVTKNLRICIDCHEFMQIASGLMNREIVVRDGSRYHSFKNGVCSCSGFW